MKIHRVITTILPRTDTFIGQVQEGNYIVEDNTVTLVSHAGVPLRNRKGETYERKLKSGDDPRPTALRRSER